MATIHMPTTLGSTVYFAESLDKIADNLKDARPTVFFGVPRIWEKFHAVLGGCQPGITIVSAVRSAARPEVTDMSYPVKVGIGPGASVHTSNAYGLARPGRDKPKTSAAQLSSNVDWGALTNATTRCRGGSVASRKRQEQGSRG